MANKYSKWEAGPMAPAQGVFEITPDDDNDLAIETRAIRCGVAGTLDIIGADGVAASCRFLAGETRAIRAVRVLETGDADEIEGMY